MTDKKAKFIDVSSSGTRRPVFEVPENRDTISKTIAASGGDYTSFNSGSLTDYSPPTSLAENSGDGALIRWS